MYTSSAPHIVLDATALPFALQTGTHSREDWRLMLISLNWIHERYSQHPENMGKVYWNSRTVQGFMTLFQLHPKLIRQWRQEDPRLEELLRHSPVAKGIWQAFHALEASSHRQVDKLPFYLQDKLYPLARYLEHRSTMFELNRFVENEHHRTLVHSLGLPISAEHADTVDIVTVADLSLLHIAESGSSIKDFFKKQTLLKRQLSFVNEGHRLVTWDDETADTLKESLLHIDDDQVTVAPPCWLMEMPPSLSQGSDVPERLEKAFQTWCVQHQWVDELSPDNEEDTLELIESSIESAFESMNNSLDLSPDDIKELLELVDDPDIEVVLHFKDSDEQIDESIDYQEEGLIEAIESDNLKAKENKDYSIKPSEYLVVSLRDEEHEDFESTLSLAFIALLDAYNYEPDEADGEGEGIERLAYHLIKQNGSAVAQQGKRRLMIFYTTGTYSAVEALVKKHPLYSFVAERVLLMPSTAYNKAMFYPKALAFCVSPTGKAFYPTILEAMAYSLPIVAPKRLSFEVLAKEGGFFFNPERPTRLPTVLHKLAQAETKRAKRAGLMARRMAETRNWQRFGEQLWKAYSFE
ncbi:MAG: glycosyltransferase [Vampirovibrionales bacterium]